VQREGSLLALVPPEVRIIELGGGRIRKALGPLVRYLKRERPDTLHILMWPLTVMGILVHRLSRSRARLGVSDHIAFTDFNITAMEKRLLGTSVRFFYPLADFRTVISQRSADSLARLSGLPREMFEVLGNPISPPAEVATNAEAEALWGDTEERLINIGSLKPQKNQRLLIEAFARLESRPNAKLMILGEGDLRADLAAQAREAGVADRVIMPGFFVDPWPFLASADLFVLSSDWEGLPLVIAEAMHAGLRIVSTDCPSGPAELLDGGKYGRLVPVGDAVALADAIDEALAEPKQPERMRRRAAEVAGPQTIDRYLEFLLGESCAPGRSL
jgi:glycosyltransferase involved in cell wall biosynthesis